MNNEKIALRCEKCGLKYKDDANYESIDEEGVCLCCAKNFNCIIEE